MAVAIAPMLRGFGLALASLVPVTYAQLPVQQFLPSPDYPDIGYGWFADVQGDVAAVFQRGSYWGPKPATYVYERKDETWRLQQRLQASWSVFKTQSGPIALSREWLAVGMPDYAPFGAQIIGAVSVYQRTEAGWKEKYLLTDPTVGLFEGIGWSLSLTDRHLAVGSSAGAGRAYVYEFQANSYLKLVAKLSRPSGASKCFGESVALDDNTLVVGAPGQFSGDQGSAYVFEPIQHTWKQVQRLQPEPFTPNQSLGWAVAVSGNHCLVGAQYQGHDGQGFVYAFQKRDATWEFAQELRPFDLMWLQRFGQSIAMSGIDAVIAASGPGAASNASVAYHFQFRSGAWVQVGKLVIDSTKEAFRNFAGDANVALSGTTALLATPGDVLTNGPSTRPQGLAFAFELGPDAVQFCTCLRDPALCGASDSDAGCGNSTGNGAMLSACGSGSVATDDLRMESRWMPKDVLGLVLMGPRADETPYGDGILCVGPGDKGLFRFPIGNSGERGRIALGPGIVAYSQVNFPAAGHIQAGDTWYFQAWYRDSNGPCGTGFNLSNGVKVDFTH